MKVARLMPRSRATLSALACLLFAAAGHAAGTAGTSRVKDSWPRQFTTSRGNSVVVYQPQLETFKGDEITGRAAVSVTRKGETSPRFGVVFFTAHVSVDRDSRLVSILQVKINRVRFPNISPDREASFAALLEKEAPKWQLAVSYDRILENLKVAERERKSAEGLKNDPPRIVFAEEPTVLVVLDGEPQLRDIEGAPLKLVVNTPFLMMLDTRTNDYFLCGGTGWWYRSSAPAGPWEPVGRPPSEIASFAARAQAQQASERDRRGAGASAGSAIRDGTEQARPPRIIVATEPTELIVSEGKPTFKPIDRLDLLLMDNTESDVLMDVGSQEYYVLLSGRWFKSKALSGGAWTFVSPAALPPSFAKIPPDSEAGEVLASVPGTDQAEDALLDAQLPQAAAIRRSEAKLEVLYDGEPQFVAIEGTTTEYAVNASTAVLKIRGRYYACADAIWYVADAAQGPWLIADSVPREDVEQIPPSAPVYNVKYVTIYDATPDVVYVGYTPGYLGCYPWGGTVVWGTGWFYPPWVGPLYYWPWPWTWGFCARYDPWSGWGFGITWSFPFFDVYDGWGGWFRPVGWRGGRGWGRGHRRGWWGPGGYRPPVTIIGDRRHPRAPGLPGARLVTGRPNIGFRPPARERRSDLFRRNLYERLPVTSKPATGVVPRQIPRSLTTRPNNVYADRDGNVYRRGKDGRWQQREGQRWVPSPGSEKGPRAVPSPKGGPTTRPAPRPELDRDFTARQRGEIRSRSAPPSGRPAPSRPSAPPPGSKGKR